MIVDLFPIPVYISEVTNLDNIQKEFTKILEKTDFFYNPIYRDSHKISDPSFRENIIVKNNCKYFLEELNHHTSLYLKLVNSSIDINTVEYYMSSWMTVNEQGDYTAQHNHAAADLSGVYYVKTPEDCGDLYFKNPNRAVSASYCFYQLPEVSVAKIKEGTIILFPSWLDHGVLSNRSVDKRVSISFNITFSRKSYT